MRKLRQAGFRLFTLTDNLLEVQTCQLERGGSSIRSPGSGAAQPNCCFASDRDNSASILLLSRSAVGSTSADATKAGANEEPEFSGALSAAFFTREHVQDPAEAVLLRGPLDVLTQRRGAAGVLPAQ